MIKLVQCVSRRPDLPVDEFRTAWEAYGARLREAATDLGAVAVTLSTTLETPLNDALAETRGSAQPFDGIAEVGWPDGAAIVAAAARPGGSGWIASLRATQGEFIDPSRSAFFFVHEQTLLGEAQSSRRLARRRR